MKNEFSCERPIPWDSSDAPFIVPQLAEVLPGQSGDAKIPCEMMSRHFIFTGETGSGKTESGVKPLMKSILNYGSSDQTDVLPCSALCVDPKHELAEFAEEALRGSGRLVFIGQPDSRIDFYEDFRSSNVSSKVLIDQALEAFVPQVRDNIESGGDNIYWHTKGREVIYSLTELAIHVAQSGSSLGAELNNVTNWSTNQIGARALQKISVLARVMVKHKTFKNLEENKKFETFRAQIRTIGSSFIQRIEEQTEAVNVVNFPNFVAAAHELKALLKLDSDKYQKFLASIEAQIDSDHSQCFAEQLWIAMGRQLPSNKDMEEFARVAGSGLTNDDSNWYGMIESILAGIVGSNAGSNNSVRDSDTPINKALVRIAERFDAVHLLPQLSWLNSPDMKSLYWYCDIAQSFIAALASPQTAERIWLHPVKHPTNAISIRECVESGKVMLFQPNLVVTEEDEMFARTLKRQFFRAVFSRQERRRGIAYICDEFQRFVTADAESGEQSFLDRCRAYRVICVLATQSVASIKYALSNQGGGKKDNSHENACTVMLNNIGNKFFFRNTDHGTHSMLKGLIPWSPVFPSHVVAVRPLSTLKPGECYALLANGAWGRYRVALEFPELGSNVTDDDRYQLKLDLSYSTN